VEFWVDQPREIAKADARVVIRARCGESRGWSAECYVELYRSTGWRARRCEMHAVAIRNLRGDPDADEPPRGPARV
jgi:hypothetical protein